MSKLWMRSLAALALLALMTSSAWAQGRGHGRGASSGQVWRADRDSDTWRNRDWRGDRDRWTFGDDRRPPGWDKGRKTGWGNCDVPPGQAKKMGCNSSSRVFSIRPRRDRDWSRDRDHRNRR